MHTLPRLAALLMTRKPAEAKNTAIPATKPASDQKPAGPTRLLIAPPPKDRLDTATGLETARPMGTVSGRDLTIWRHRQDVLIAWGDGVLTAAQGAGANPGRSIAPLCTGWAVSGKPAPERLGVVWPARCWATSPAPAATAAASSALAADPPVVWWGWNHETKASDSIRWAGLRPRVQRFLDGIPLDPQPSD